MALTFDEQIETALRNYKARLRIANAKLQKNWMFLGCYLGHYGEWFTLSMGETLEIAIAFGNRERCRIEAEGADFGWPQEIPWVMAARWWWGEWRNFDLSARAA